MSERCDEERHPPPWGCWWWWDGSPAQLTDSSSLSCEPPPSSMILCKRYVKPGRADVSWNNPAYPGKLISGGWPIPAPCMCSPGDGLLLATKSHRVRHTSSIFMCNEGKRFASDVWHVTTSRQRTTCLFKTEKQVSRNPQSARVVAQVGSDGCAGSLSFYTFFRRI